MMGRVPFVVTARGVLRATSRRLPAALPCCSSLHALPARSAQVTTTMMPHSLSGATRTMATNPFGDSDDEGLQDNDLFGSEPEVDERESHSHMQVLDEAEEEATAAFLKSAGVKFSPEETTRIRKKAREFSGVVKSRTENEPASPFSATPFADIDPFTEFELRRDSNYTDPRVEYDWDSKVIPLSSDDMVVRRRGGLSVQYCVFCYHGASMLRPENTTLLSKFTSDRGKIVPKRISNCCAKHQRKLKRTVKRARQLQLMPYSSRLHPKLRSTQWMPDPDTHKPVTFTTPRDAYKAAQKFDKWGFSHSKEWNGQPPQVDWFPEEE